MLKLRSLIEEHLQNGKVMQLATCVNERPWVCSVYYVVDQELNIYWLSLPTRRHSEELQINNRAAITIMVKNDIPVIGLSAEGVVIPVRSQKVVSEVMKLYIQKYNAGHDFASKKKEQENLHEVYSFRPEKYVCFDEVNLEKNISHNLILN